MSQHDMNLANADGATFRADLNNALQAIAEQNSGPSEPSTTFAYQWWADTTNDLLKQRNAANDDWVTILSLSSGNATTPGNNIIINGAMLINQRAVSGTVSLSSGEYGHDRFRGGSSGCTYTFSGTGSVTTLTISSGTLEQVIEDKNVPGGDVVLTWEGTAQGRIDGGAYGDSGDVTATLTSGTQAIVEFGTGTLTQVQLESGTVSSDFEHRSYGEELALCQRYFQKSAPQSSSLIDTGFGAVYSRDGTASSVPRYIPVRFVRTMRATPTVSIYDGSGNVGYLRQDSTDWKPAYVGLSSDQSMMIYGPSGLNHYITYFGFYLDAEL